MCWFPDIPCHHGICFCMLDLVLSTGRTQSPAQGITPIQNGTCTVDVFSSAGPFFINRKENEKSGMKQTNKKSTRYIWILPVLWMCLIFAFSSQPGNDSSRMSGGVTRIIESIAGFFNINTGRFDLHLIVRKSAHFLEYAILGALFFTAFHSASGRPFPRAGWRAGLRAQAAGMGYAVTDELHQWFVPGRSCQVRDMLIDSCGVLLAVLICCAFYLARGRRHAEFH